MLYANQAVKLAKDVVEATDIASFGVGFINRDASLFSMIPVLLPGKGELDLVNRIESPQKIPKMIWSAPPAETLNILKRGGPVAMAEGSW